jgi:hypothetical protein
MSDSTNPFITLPSTADFTRSASRKSRRNGILKSYDLQSNINKAAYYDAMINAMKEGKTEADAIIHAQAAVQAIDDELKLKAALTAEVAMDKSSAQCGQINEVNNESENDSDIDFDDDGNPLIIAGQKGRSAFDKLQSALSKISAFSALKKESKENVEILNIRELHKKLDVTVSQYDTIMDRVLGDLEYHMENLFYEKLLEAEDKFKGKLRLQYETLRSHVGCDAQINSLRTETTILKQEMKDMIMKNSQTSLELKDLRIFKSNAEAQERLMAEQLANRKTYIKVLTNKVKKLQESLAMKSTDTQEDHTCHESYPSENELTEHEEEAKEMTNIAAEEMSPEEIAKWYMNAQASRPKWNTSRKTNLLNKEIFSIMHEIKDDNFKDTFKMIEEDIYLKIDRKYKTQISGLKFQLESERKEARKVSAINAKRYHKMKQIIDVLTDCLAVLHNDQKDTEATITNSVIFFCLF